jgi:hypothetical protein
MPKQLDSDDIGVTIPRLIGGLVDPTQLPAQGASGTGNAPILYSGTAYPQRSTSTTRSDVAVFWIGSVAPPTTAGYALPIDIWLRRP